MDFVRLWLHEATRVYGDKLVEEKDIGNLQKLKMDIVKATFEVCMSHTIRLMKLSVFMHLPVLCDSIHTTVISSMFKLSLQTVTLGRHSRLSLKAVTAGCHSRPSL